MSRTRIAAAMLALATIGLALFIFASADAALLGALRIAVSLVGGIAVGGIALLAIGRLLANAWHEAVRDELLPMAAVLPAVVLLAAPLLLLAPAPAEAIFGEALTPAREAWFAPHWRLTRLASAAAALLAATALAARAPARPVSAVVLAATTLASLLLSVDWLLTLPPVWWSKLLPFCAAASQLGAALSVAFITNLLQRETLEDPHHRSLAAGLLALALLGGWVWFAQFLTAWYGNLPAEARWYAVRTGDVPLLAAAAAAQGLGIVVLTVLHRRRAALLTAATALLAAYFLHGMWLLGPAAPDAGAGLRWGVLLATAALAAGWLAFAARRHDQRLAATNR